MTSLPPNEPNSATEPPRPSGSQAALMLFGVLLLLPGICSLLVALDTKLDPKEPMFGTLIAVWVATLGLAVLGIVLIFKSGRNSGEPQ